MYGTMNSMHIKSRKQYSRRRFYQISFLVFFALVLFSIIFITKTVTAERNTDRTKMVTSIQIKNGDTLWSIASSFMSEEYDDIEDYIEEIKASNGLATDTIHAGNYIIVPYYADASK